MYPARSWQPTGSSCLPPVRHVIFPLSAADMQLEAYRMFQMRGKKELCPLSIFVTGLSVLHHPDDLISLRISVDVTVDQQLIFESERKHITNTLRGWSASKSYLNLPVLVSVCLPRNLFLTTLINPLSTAVPAKCKPQEVYYIGRCSLTSRGGLSMCLP